MRFKHIHGRRTFEDKSVFNSINSIIKSKRGYSVRIPPKKARLFFLISGGIDSICLWGYLMDKLHLHVYPLHILSKKKRKGVVQTLSYFSDFYKNKYPDLFHPIKIIQEQRDFSFRKANMAHQLENDINLIDNNIVFEEEDSHKYIIAPVSNPSRMGYYAFLAYDYAHTLRHIKNLNINTIIMAIVADDKTVIREATQTAMRAINLSLCATLGDYSWQFIGPIEKGFYLKKHNLIKYALNKGIPVNYSWSCDIGNSRPCNHCAGCTERRHYFHILNIQDRIWDTNFEIIYRKIMALLRAIRRRLVRLSLYTEKIITHTESQINKTTLDKQIKINPHVQYKLENGICRVLNTETGEFFSLNQTGSAIFYLVKKRKVITISHIVTHLRKEYRISLQKNQKGCANFCTKEDF